MATTTRPMTENPVVRRIVELIRKRGKHERDLTDYIGIAPGAMSKWKYDGSYVYIKYIKEICEFLDTTPNYLFLGPDDEEERLTPKERELLETYRKLDDGRKECITQTLRYFVDNKKYSTKRVVKN